MFEFSFANLLHGVIGLLSLGKLVHLSISYRPSFGPNRSVYLSSLPYSLLQGFLLAVSSMMLLNVLSFFVSISLFLTQFLLFTVYFYSCALFNSKEVKDD